MIDAPIATVAGYTMLGFVLGWWTRAGELGSPPNDDIERTDDLHSFEGRVGNRTKKAGR